MVKLLGKTIRQLSEELKLSKQAINQRINSINGFRSKHTYKVKNHLEIDNQGVKMLANFDKQKRQERQTNRQAENDKDDVLSNNVNTRHSKDKNDKQNENRVAEYNNRQKKVSKNKVNNSWWRFW